MYQELEGDTGPETRQECTTAQPDNTLGLGKAFVLAEQEEEMPWALLASSPQEEELIVLLNWESGGKKKKKKICVQN